MKALYLDLFSGISGDMFLGALIDLGVPLDVLEHELRRLPLDGSTLRTSRQSRGGIAGTKFDVVLAEPPHPQPGSKSGPAAGGHGHSDGGHPRAHAHDEAHAHGPAGGPGHELHGDPAEHAHPHGRDYAGIRESIQGSKLSPWTKGRALAVFERIAHAEGRIHGVPPEAVRFHEVGAVDSIVDIVGACVALDWLGRPQVLASPVCEGTGWVRCAHGQFPLPAPATLEILAARNVPVSQCDEPHELVTPTGAALLAEFAESFAPLRDFQTARIGYGLGARENRSRPNALRALLGESPAAPAPASAHDWETDEIAILESNLDDATGEVLGHFLERALAAGALDVFHTPIQMKKNRPGVALTLLCPAADADRFAEMVLCETTAFGLRCTRAQRRKLRREFVTAATAYGTVTLKLGWLDGRRVQAAPEYESCRAVAAAAGVPLCEVYEAARRAFHQDSVP